MADEPNEKGEKRKDRDEKGRFIKGKEGGPGRPIGSISVIGEIKKYFEENPEKFEDFVQAIINDPAMRRAIMEQIDGKPKQPIEHQGGIEHIHQLDDDQFKQLIHRARKRIDSSENGK